MPTYVSLNSRLYHTNQCKAIRDSIAEGKIAKNYTLLEDPDYALLHSMRFHECAQCERLGCNEVFEDHMLPHIQPLMHQIITILNSGNYEFRVYEYVGNNKTPQCRYRSGTISK